MRKFILALFGIVAEDGESLRPNPVNLQQLFLPYRGFCARKGVSCVVIYRFLRAHLYRPHVELFFYHPDL